MYKKIEAMGSRLLETFVPRIEAAALQPCRTMYKQCCMCNCPCNRCKRMCCRQQGEWRCGSWMCAC